MAKRKHKKPAKWSLCPAPRNTYSIRTLVGTKEDIRIDAHGALYRRRRVAGKVQWHKLDIMIQPKVLKNPRRVFRLLNFEKEAG